MSDALERHVPFHFNLTHTENQKAVCRRSSHLGLMLKIPDNAPLRPINVETRNDPVHCLNVEQEPDGKHWYHDMEMFLRKEFTLPVRPQSIRRQYNEWPSNSFSKKKSYITNRMRMCC